MVCLHMLVKDYSQGVRCGMRAAEMAAQVFSTQLTARNS
jgi:hypothetical protein